MKNPTQRALACVAAGAIALAFAGCAPQVIARADQTPANAQARLQTAIQEGEALKAKTRPALDAILAGDYATARARFEALESAGLGQFGEQRVRCLLGEGRVDEGLALLAKLRPGELGTEDAANLRVALDVKGRRERDLVSALQNRATLPAFESSSANPNAVTVTPPSEANRLMAVAVEFGRKYDRDTMHSLADEAMRRGQVDVSALAEYAFTTASNGDLRKARDLYKQILPQAKTPLLRTHVEGMVYDLGNIITLAERQHPIEKEENARRTKCRQTFFLSSWR